MNQRKKAVLGLVLAAAVAVGGVYAAKHRPWAHPSRIVSSETGSRVGEGEKRTSKESGPEEGSARNAPVDTLTALAPLNKPKGLQALMIETAQMQQSLSKNYNKGKTLFFQHQYQKAVQVEDSVIQQDSAYEPAYNVKGIALCYGGDFSDGMDNINKALSLNPKDDYAHFNKALALELYAHYDAALREYHKTIPIASPNWKQWSYYGIAAIYGRRGDVKDTVSYLKKAIAMNPTRVKEVARTESDFDNVRQSAAFQNLLK